MATFHPHVSLFQLLSSSQVGAHLKNLGRCNGPPLSQEQIQELSECRDHLMLKKLLRATLLHLRNSARNSVLLLNSGQLFNA